MPFKNELEGQQLKNPQMARLETARIYSSPYPTFWKGHSPTEEEQIGGGREEEVGAEPTAKGRPRREGGAWQGVRGKRAPPHLSCGGGCGTLFTANTNGTVCPRMNVTAQTRTGNFQNL